MHEDRHFQILSSVEHWRECGEISIKDALCVRVKLSDAFGSGGVASFYFFYCVFAPERVHAAKSDESVRM
jgi:ribosomal protein L11 methylase PrmA